jgi:tetratricopeptide (TPR) repeat protein
MSTSPATNAGPQAHVAAGFDLLRQGRVEEAWRLGDALLASHPLDSRVLGLAVEARLALDEPDAALALLDAALAKGAPAPLVLPRRAHVLMALMRRADAKAVAAELAALSGGSDARALWAAGRIFSRCDDPAGAAKQFEAAARAGCDDPELLYDLAAAQFFLGRFDEAERNLNSLLARVPIAGDAMYLRSTLRMQTNDRNHVAQLEQRLRSRIPNPVDAAGCCYALAKELEDLGQWDRSFAVLSRGAALKRGSLSYNAAAERQGIDAIAVVYTAEVVAGSVPGSAKESPIFVVGLPRTGTTLVERILSRHRKAASVGELPYFGGALATTAGRLVRAGRAPGMLAASLQVDFAALGRAYLDGARQAADGDPRRLVDKMPINFMYCGLIRKALPNARIIHVTRDPMDACYAIYKTLFQNAYHYSYDLGELAAYYASYHRLMRHWHGVMPDGVLEVRYENLVADPEGQVRRMLEWCGLEWDPEVLAVTGDDRPSTTASAAQVRRPMHAGSIGKWHRFESGLAPLHQALREAGVIGD